MKRLHCIFMGLIAGLSAAAAQAKAWPQEANSHVVRAADLPDAPDAMTETGGASQDAPALALQGTGSVAGIVSDINQGVVAGARVTLSGAAIRERTTDSDAGGRFAFINLPAGRFTFKVAAPGLQTFVSSEISLRAGEHQELQQISLPIASTTADVQVTVTEVELAQEQITLEEKQRVLGVLPNFYTSYIWNAAPLTKKQKYSLALHSALDPTEFIGASVQAATEQWAGTFAGYGDDAAGYGKRFAASYGDGAIARMIGSAVLPSLLHQDPRYFYLGSGTKKARALYALKMAVMARSDQGRLQPAYSYIGGAFLSGGISNAYHPHGDRGAGLVISNGFIDIAGHAFQNVIREFALRSLTPNVPDYERGRVEPDLAAKKKDR